MSELRVTDKGIEKMVSNLLRAGVIISGTVVAIGGAFYLLRHGKETVDYHVFKGLPATDRILPDILSSAVHNRARSLIQVGIVLLILTPVARVAASLAGFALERDKKYVLITAIVLSVLLCSLITGAIRG